MEFVASSPVHNYNETEADCFSMTRLTKTKISDGTQLAMDECFSESVDPSKNNLRVEATERAVFSGISSSEATSPPVDGRPIEETGWQRFVLNVFGMVFLLMIALIALQVVAAFFGWNPLVQFQSNVFFLGQSINQNTLTDLQWALLSVIALMPAWLVWLQDGHVRVDFLWLKFSACTQNRLELVGHLLFSIPFLVLSLPAAWMFAARSFASGEMTSHGGITDLFLVKSTLIVGLLSLAVVLVFDIFKRLRAFFAA